MVPSRVALLTALPRTANGKLDRAALVRNAEQAPLADEAPADETLDGAVMRIWSEVLGVASVSADSDFFELGGNSLAAAIVTIRAGEERGVELPLQVIFDHPKLSEFVDVVRQELAGSPGGR